MLGMGRGCAFCCLATSIKIYILMTPSINRKELFKLKSVEAESIISKSTCATEKKRKDLTIYIFKVLRYFC